MKTINIEVNLVYLAIAAAACGFLCFLAICVFVIARKCRTPKDIRGKVALVKINLKKFLCHAETVDLHN